MIKGCQQGQKQGATRYCPINYVLYGLRHWATMREHKHKISVERGIF